MITSFIYKVIPAGETSKKLGVPRYSNSAWVSYTIKFWKSIRNLNNFNPLKVPWNGMIYKKTARNGRFCFSRPVDGRFPAKDSQNVRVFPSPPLADKNQIYPEKPLKNQAFSLMFSVVSGCFVIFDINWRKNWLFCVFYYWKYPFTFWFACVTI